MEKTTFDWDTAKDRRNQQKHGISFSLAQRAFADPKRVVLLDMEHSAEERRYYCIGCVGPGIMTVRFTLRGHVIRIFGAGYWRKGKKLYDEQNQLHE
ncbi:MAG TPA: BrnT family toxin [Kiritimatiellia bacterium]|nr:BrnT family toxin [Kiritimatiellia bacterium]HMP35676.1 BrnT family toxin [Kiritimatiellia bacterium]